MESVKIHISIKCLFVLLVICLCIELEYLDLQLLNVLQLHSKTDWFLYFESLLIVLSKLENDLVCNLLVLLNVDLFLEANDPILRAIDFGSHFNLLDLPLCEVQCKFSKRALCLLTKVLKISITECHLIHPVLLSHHGGLTVVIQSEPCLRALPSFVELCFLLHMVIV
jgi:hypothetical protein